MRLTILILITAILQVSANSFAQKITLSERNASLVKVFEKIRSQSGYDFMFALSTINNAKPVNINVQDAELKEVLKQIFVNQPLEYKINEKSVVVSPKESTFLERVVATLAAIDVRGRILDEQKNPLPGATVKVKGTNQSTVTNEKGEFYLHNVSDQAVLVIAYVGYAQREVGASKNLGDISLSLSDNKLEEVNVTVNTGYQTLSKERATGSFSYVDNKLLNRSVGTNVLDRLDGVTSGVIFGKQANKANSLSTSNGGDPGISIRGRSTLFANTEPLIVLDNFPYDGDLNNINPNDIESVTVLKDAAAGSIWGVRAGNGVIVLTSKKGREGKIPSISINSNITVTGKPDLYKVPQLTSPQYIELEKYLFDNGYYDISLQYIRTNPQSQVVDLLERITSNPDQEETLLKQIDALGNIDTRDDYTKYFLRNAVSQQYALNINGGSSFYKYYLSTGYDHNLQSPVSDTYNRINLTANNSFSFFNSRLNLNTSIFFTRSKAKNNPYPYFINSYPYEKLVDEYGNALPVIRDYRQVSKDDLAGKGFLDWNYYPYNERLNNNSINDLTDYRVGIQSSYKILPDLLDIDLNYQYQQGNNTQSLTRSQDIYSTRVMINQFTQIDPSGLFTYPIPLGDIVDNNLSNYSSNSGRIQLNYHQYFNAKHEISAIAGTELKDYHSFQSDSRLYGYNESTAINIPVNYFEDYNYSIGYTSSRIPNVYGQNGTVDRYFSYYVNASYTFNDKYSLNTSLRKDESNLFGVNANQKGVPLYSVGLSWNLSKESFYKINLIPYLKLRLTNGYNGNLSKALSAYTTARTFGLNIFNNPRQQILNPPNPELTWEKVHVINGGLDFGFENSVITGSIDFYSKKGINLIGNSPVAPQLGVIQFTGNAAEILTKGLDIVLNSSNLKGRLGWTTNFLINYVQDKITSYKLQKGVNSTIVENNYINPVEGKSYSSIFSYAWAGLDDQGNPQGILDGQISKDYAAIQNSRDITNLVYSGTATPTWFGSVRNNFTFKGAELSFNVIYKLGYYFRRGSFGLDQGFMHADFDQRWMNPGDELKTNVPALSYPIDGAREAFYAGSQILIEKADHIRLQDLQLAYNLSMKKSESLFKSLKLYGVVNNIGILWRANKYRIDPDYAGKGFYYTPNPKSIAIGIKAEF